MPAIICVSIADADLGKDFHWQLLLGIVAGKAVIFAAVAVVAACLNKPVDLVFSGIYAMFSVQCNDLPVGNPLISSLYRFVRPHMTKYLFFLPSLTLIVFGPISHLMTSTTNGKNCDREGVDSTHVDGGSRKTIFAKTVDGILRNALIRYISKNFFQNPVIIATVTGLLLNLIFGAKIPATLRHPIHVLAQTIPGIALCVLGFSMIGKERYLLSSSLIPALVLVFVKMVLTPLILHVTVKSLTGGATFTKELCDFALLYGIISPAAVIFEEAKRKNVHTAAMGAALIISSLTCFPLSYAIAKWTVVRLEAPSVYANDISNLSFQVSCASLACGASTLCIIWCKKFGNKRMSAHLSIQGLVLFQLAIASGALLRRLAGTKSRWLYYLHLAVSTYGEIGVYVWASIFVIVMMLQKKMILVLKHSSLVIVTATCGTALLITSVAVVMKRLETKRTDSDSRCVIDVVDHSQLILTTSVLAVSFAITCLAFYRQRSSWSNDGEVVHSDVYFIGEAHKQIQGNKNDNVSKWMHEATKSTSALFPEAEMSTYHEYVINATDNEFVQLCGPKWSRRILSLLTLQTLVMSSVLNRLTLSKMEKVNVKSPNVRYTEKYIEAFYCYETTKVEVKNGCYEVTPERTKIQFRTERHVPKLGVMLVGWGGNNGTTITGAVLANSLGITWRTKDGVQKPNYYGSLTQSATVSIGTTSDGEELFIPIKDLMPMVKPEDIVIGGWDISSMNIGDAMERAKVFDFDLQRQLKPLMEKMKPLPAIYDKDFIAANQEERADNNLKGTKLEQMNQIRKDISNFKKINNLDKVIVLWTANTERFCLIKPGLNDTAENLLRSIEANESEISPSTLYAVASILEKCAYINGSPQNTFVPGCIELAEKNNVHIGGDDFKSGQTKFKSVMVDFLVGAGIKPVSLVSYNHLGNNDGKNLSAPLQFRSKEISKSNVVDDIIAGNSVLYEKGEKPDHCVVIKYVPYVGDSKRALDEYTSEIMMGGKNTIVVHNTCEDSLLASPIILDLAILTELCERISLKMLNGTQQEVFQPLNSVLSVLSYLIKAPLVPRGAPIINALFKQRACIENLLRACLGLAPQNHIGIEHKLSNPEAWYTEQQGKVVQQTSHETTTKYSPKDKKVSAFVSEVMVSTNGFSNGYKL